MRSEFVIGDLVRRQDFRLDPRMEVLRNIPLAVLNSVFLFKIISYKYHRSSMRDKYLRWPYLGSIFFPVHKRIFVFQEVGPAETFAKSKFLVFGK